MKSNDMEIFDIEKMTQKSAALDEIFKAFHQILEETKDNFENQINKSEETSALYGEYGSRLLETYNNCVLDVSNFDEMFDTFLKFIEVAKNKDLNLLEKATEVYRSDSKSSKSSTSAPIESGSNGYVPSTSADEVNERTKTETITTEATGIVTDTGNVTGNTNGEANSLNRSSGKNVQAIRTGDNKKEETLVGDYITDTAVVVNHEATNPENGEKLRGASGNYMGIAPTVTLDSDDNVNRINSFPSYAPLHAEELKDEYIPNETLIVGRPLNPQEFAQKELNARIDNLNKGQILNPSETVYKHLSGNLSNLQEVNNTNDDSILNHSNTFVASIKNDNDNEIL